MTGGRTRKVWIGLALGFVVVFSNAGCTGKWVDGFFDDDIRLREDIEAEDEDGLFPGVRVNLNLLEDGREPRVGLLDSWVSSKPVLAPAATPAAPTAAVPARAEDTPAPEPPDGWFSSSAVRSTMSIDAEYAVGVGGNEAQNLSRGPTSVIDYDGQRLTGTPTVQHRYDLHLATVGPRSGVRIRERVGLEILGGLSISALRLRVQAPGRSVRDTGVSMGVHVGGRVTITPHPALDLFGQGKIHLMGGLQEDRRTVFMATAMAGGDLHLTSLLSVYGGWRWWRYSEDVHSASNIDEIVLTGPSFGALLRF